MNLVGTVLAGRYEIAEEIGNGGMANVYKAKCRILNRYVAIKVLRNELKDDAEFVRRFNVEAQSAASLTHPNIVSIYDVGTDGDIHYIVMEYVEGITLKDYIDQNGMLSWSEALGYAIQIASGLEQAHNNSIVHRDIKPHNIIMTPEGVLKITDFGIARASAQSTVNCEDTAIGSVHYVSPEQARGGYVDERSDIYSLGVVLYEMLTGKVPFDNESPVSIALMHLQSTPTPPRELNLGIPKAVEEIVLKAMSKEVAKRYKTISEMKAELIACSKALSSPAVAVSKTDELGGAATFTASKEIPDEEDILIADIQKPSVTSNLIPNHIAEEKNSPDIELDIDDDNDFLEGNTVNRKKERNVRPFIIISALLAAFAIIVFVVYLLWGTLAELFADKNTKIEIPEFANKQYEDVMAEYGDDGRFDFYVEYTEKPSKSDGIILSQSPGPGDEREPGSNGKIRITLVVNNVDGLSDNPDEPTVDEPNEDDETKEDKENIKLKKYEGKKYDDCKAEFDKFKKLGIKVSIKEVESDEYDKNIIIEQSEPKGTKLSEISSLTITVSKGKKDEGGQNPTEPTARRKFFTIYGPAEGSALVEVYANGKLLKSEVMAAGSNDTVTISSTSETVTVVVYHDKVEVDRQEIKMTE